MAAGDVKNAYSALATVTITLTSLADGSARESTVIDNTSNKYLDLILRAQSRCSGAATGQVNIYAYASLSDTTYTDGATGSDAAFTAANRLNSKLVGSLQMNGTSPASLVESVRAAFGGTLPSKVGFIFVNAAGAALSATAGHHIVEVQGVYATVEPAA